MTKMIDPTDLATARLFERVDPAIDLTDQYERSHPCATNGQLDECEHAETEPTPIEVWQPTEPQYCKAIYSYYGVQPRTVQKWAKRILEVCPWFDESEFRLPDDRYTPLCIKLMGSYYTSGLDAPRWAKTIVNLYADRIATWQNAQSAVPLQQNANAAQASTVAGLSPDQPVSDPSPIVGFAPLDLSKMKTLDVPVTPSEIVPEVNPITVGSLAQRNDALVQGRSDLAAALLLAEQVQQLVQHTVQLDIEQSEAEEKQTVQLEDVMFELNIHKECLQRQERASNIRRGYRNARRNRAEAGVLEMRDFFAKRAGSPVSEVSQG